MIRPADIIRNVSCNVFRMTNVVFLSQLEGRSSQSSQLGLWYLSLPSYRVPRIRTAECRKRFHLLCLGKFAASCHTLSCFDNRRKDNCPSPRIAQPLACRLGWDKLWLSWQNFLDWMVVRTAPIGRTLRAKQTMDIVGAHTVGVTSKNKSRAMEEAELPRFTSQLLERLTESLHRPFIDEDIVVRCQLLFGQSVSRFLYIEEIAIVVEIIGELLLY